MTTFKQIAEDLFIGSQPSEQDLTHAQQLGIRTVIDLRMPGETSAPNATATATKKHGLDYLNIPVDKSALSEQQIGQLDQAMQCMPGPYLLHCATGARAALLLTLRRARENGWTTARAFDEARTIGFNLEGSAEFANFIRQVTAGNTPGNADRKKTV